ncbi:MAG TPA: heme-copper oxidase subunit III [Opitutaceae bacterium]|nr:heme-copper oxidase subunit III [Opitutaceae bacterium]
MSSATTADPAALAHHDPTTATGVPNKKILMWAFLASDCMFFGALISTHLIYRLHPMPGTPSPREIFDLELTSFSTFILLMSSVTMALAVNAIQHGQLGRCRGMLMATILFGGIFLGCQVYEFNHFVHEKSLTLSGSILGSTFYTLTGTHGIHVLLGVVWLCSILLYSAAGKLRPQDAIDVESAGLYWHFVDIVWIVIFTAVYLLEYLHR